MNIKRTITAVILAVAVITPSALAVSFTDTRGHWAEDTISTLADKGIVSGVSATEFNPDGTVTRAEFLRMALGTMKVENVKYREGECLDVKNDAWYADTVQTGLECGIIPDAMIKDCSIEIKEEGSDTRAVYHGSFNAEAPITREEMAYVAEAAYTYSLEKGALKTMKYPKDLDFDDTSSISVWAIDGVRHAYSDSIISGMGDGTFAPKSTATRAQAAVIINNILNKAVN